MLGSGNLGKQMDMESIPGLMAIDMKANLNNVSNMEKGWKSLRMEIFIRATMRMENQMGLESTTGKTEATSKAILGMGFEMAKVFGKGEWETQTNMRDSTKMIKRVGMESSHGPLETCIKETMKETFEMDMEKCIGTITVSTKEIGKMVCRMATGKFMSLAKAIKKESLRKIRLLL